MARRTGRDFFVRVLNQKEVKTVEGILKPYGLGYNGGSFTRDEENGDVFHVGIDMRGKGTCNESGLMQVLKAALKAKRLILTKSR